MINMIQAAKDQVAALTQAAYEKAAAAGVLPAGTVVKATIVLMKGHEGTPELTKELQDYVKHQTAPYKYPRIVEYVSELPKTISGKIRRVAIRQGEQK